MSRNAWAEGIHQGARTVPRYVPLIDFRQCGVVVVNDRHTTAASRKQYPPPVCWHTAAHESIGSRSTSSLIIGQTVRGRPARCGQIGGRDARVPKEVTPNDIARRAQDRAVFECRLSLRERDAARNFRGAKGDYFWLIRPKGAPEVFKAWLKRPMIICASCRWT